MVTTVDKGNSSEKAGISESVRKMELKIYAIRIHNYSVRKGVGVGECLTSGKIVVGGHRWTVNLYPQGISEDAHDAGYVSIYIKRTSSVVEPLQLLCGIFIADQSGKVDYIGHSTFNSKEVGFVGRMIGFRNLISRAALDSPDSPYLKHDSLKIMVEIGVFTYHNRVGNHWTSSTANYKQLLKWQWQDEFVFFRVDDRTYCGAKSIIVARCPAMLDKHQFQGAIPISDIDPDIFRAALYFVFFDSLLKCDREAVDDSDPLNHESFAANLLAAADRFEIKGLKSICESRLSKKVSRDSVVCLLDLAHLCNAAELKSACLKFAARNRSVMIESDECEFLKETCPLLFLDLGDNISIPSNNKGLLKAAVSIVRESLIGVKESLVARCWSWSSPNKKQKMKIF